jgi:hypothetical protein
VLKERKDREVEFIQLLSEILDLKGTAFAKKIGKHQPNVSGYLAGNNIPRKKVLHSALRHAFEWEVAPLVEVQSVEEHANQLPQTPGVYCFYDSSGSVIYVGQATKLKTEVGLALQRLMNFPVRLGSPQLSKKEHRKYKTIARYLSAYSVPSPRMRHNLEALLLRVFPNQSHNNKIGNFI